MPYKRRTIVIAEDNDMLRAVLRSLLRGGEYEVVGEARNGTAAVELALRLKPDIVCMDIAMPGKNGIEALAEIKASQPATDVVMITGSTDTESVRNSIQKGANGYIVKPFNAARVLDTLGKLTKHAKPEN